MPTFEKENLTHSINFYRQTSYPHSACHAIQTLFSLFIPFLVNIILILLILPFIIKALSSEKGYKNNYYCGGLENKKGREERTKRLGIQSC